MASTTSPPDGVKVADSATSATPEMPFPVHPETSNRSATTTPSLPPAIDSIRSHTADEVVQMMKQTPLFMTSLDDGADE
ncbi:MAG: hypothetical protein Q9183_006275, partial [Haloplaca sp. 2 TL-2023]